MPGARQAIRSTLAMDRRAVDAGKGRRLTMRATMIVGHPGMDRYVRL
jgi:hypothetical protein